MFGSHIYVKAQFFCMTQPSKKLSNKFLGPYEILALPGHSLTSGQSPCCTPSFPHLNVGTSNSESNPQLHSTPTPPIIVDGEPESPKSSTPRLTTDVVPASYCILSVGQGMRAPMKKLPGSSLPNSDMLLNLLQISTLHIQPSLVLFQVFDLGALQFLKSY